MVGGYNLQRERLALEHQNALRTLSGLYVRNVGSLLLSLAGEGNSGLISAFTNALPIASHPFQLSAAQLGFQFFNMRRDMAAENARGTVPKNNLTLGMFDIDNMAKMAMQGNLAAIGFSLYKGMQEGKQVQELAPEILKTSSTMVANVNRELVKQVSDEDDFSTGYVVAVKPTGCAFCKSMTLDWGVDEALHFHDYCSCVVDASFKDEVKFRQAFHEQYFKDVDEAKALIIQGGAGERTVQAGKSEEWEAQIKKELAPAARTWRKEVFEVKDRTAEQKKNNRLKTDEKVETLTQKASLVAQGKAQWNPKELSILNGWGVDVESLSKPRTVPVATITRKNVDVALEIVQGNRQVKQ
jgi:hypothetical protein